MNSQLPPRSQALLFAATAVAIALCAISQARAQQPTVRPIVPAVEKPYMVEWVYKVKWGYADEFWQLFKKYQIAT